MREAKTNFKEISAKAQVAKVKIDSMVSKLENLKLSLGNKANDDKIIEEEEFSLIKELKELKTDYKSKSNFLKQTKAQI